MKVLPPFVDDFLHLLVDRIDPQLAIMVGQSPCSSKSVLAFLLHCYYE
jgi:hypothetical protein